MVRAPLILFDLDDTLIQGYLENGAKVRPFEKVALLPNVLRTIRYLAEAWPQQQFAIVSNQAGVAFGHETVDSVEHKLGRSLAALKFFYGHPFSVHVCYDHPQATVQEFRRANPRRKPGPGMLWDAMSSHRRVPQQCLMVGDLPTDAQAAESAGIRHIHPRSFFNTVQ